MNFKFNLLYSVPLVLFCLLGFAEKSTAQNDCGDAGPVIETQIECNEETAESIVLITVTGGSPPYTLIGDLGGQLQEGEAITIGPVPDGNSATVTIIDQADCTVEYQSGILICSKCQAQAGIMPKVLQYVCGDDELQLITSDATVGENNALVYILHDNSGDNLGTIYATKTQDEYFTIDDLLTGGGMAGTEYYISAVAGPDTDSDGHPDLGEGCTQVAEGTPVIFSPLVELLSIVDCDSQGQFDLSISVNGGVPPYTISGDYTATDLTTADFPLQTSSFTDGSQIDINVEDAIGCMQSWSNVVNCAGSAQTTVWPGDADNNGICSIGDLLPIGLYYGFNGLGRNDANTNWQGQSSLVWNQDNVVYADCDGNSIIDENDAQIILDNLAQTHNDGNNTITYPTGSNGLPIYFETDDVFVNSGNQHTISVNLGDGADVTAYGISFIVNISTAANLGFALEDYTLSFDSSWLGIEGQNMITLNQVVGNDGFTQSQAWHIALTRNNQEEAIGWGELCRLALTLQLEGSEETEIPLNLSFSEIQIIGNDGLAQTSNPNNDFELILNNYPTSVEDITVISDKISLSPNPANQTVYLQLHDSQSFVQANYRIYNLTGQTVIATTPLSMTATNSAIALDISTLQQGVYFLELQSQTQRAVKRLVVYE